MQKEIFIQPDIKNIKPFVKWAGGKSQLLNEIINTIPNTFKNGDFVYIEPFVGSGAVLFKILALYYKNVKKTIINDINPVLIKAYKSIKSEPNNFIAKLKKLSDEYYQYESDEDRKNLFYEKRELYNSIIAPDIEKAALLLFLNRTCFNGLYRENKSGKFNVPFGRYKTPKILNEELINTLHRVLQSVDIYEEDYSKTIDYIDTQNVLFYLDPPYRPISTSSSFASYTKDVFDDKEQERLKEFCDLIDKNN
ncbi:DNA adenine methylase, partial [Candidatus Neomarinimicrobiota bacterium]